MSSELRVGDVFAGHRIDGRGERRRDGRRLPRHPPAARAHGRAEADRAVAGANPAFRSRFEREWRMLAALDHPNVIDIYEAGEIRRAAVPVHALGARRRPRGAAARHHRARAEGRARHPRPGRRRARRRPRARRRAPRHQARQRPARRRARVADRLRRRQGPRGPRHADRDRPVGRDRRLRRAGVARRQDRDAALGRLLARLRAVRGAHRARAVRARERRRDAVGAPLPAAAEVLGGPRRAARGARRRAAARAGQGARRSARRAPAS